MLREFFSSDDTGRAERALRKLRQHAVGGWVLTGSLATEMHHHLRGLPVVTRQLNDIDFITTSFDELPETLRWDYLFRHVHPIDPPGKTILQAIDFEERLRIDVFRAHGGVFDRASEVRLAGATIRLISLSDLMARMARLAMDLTGNVAVPAKYARDFLRLVQLVDTEAVDTVCQDHVWQDHVWQDHRKPGYPQSFAAVREQLEDLIPLRQDLLATQHFSRDTTTVCERCRAGGAFRLAAPQSMLQLLGYC